MPRRRQPIVLAEYVQGDPAVWFDAIRCEPVGHDAKPASSERVRVGKDSPRISRLVAEIDEAQTFRRTYIRPLPKEDE